MFKLEANSEQLLQITDIMEHDSELLENWQDFFRRIKVESSWAIQYGRRFSRGSITWKTLLLKGLECWISKAGTNATIPKLCEILKGLGYTNLYEQLTNKFILPLQNSSTNMDPDETPVAEASSPLNEESPQNSARRFRERRIPCTTKKKVLSIAGSVVIVSLFTIIIVIILVNKSSSKTVDKEFVLTTVPPDFTENITSPSLNVEMKSTEQNPNNSTTTDVVQQKRMWLTEWVSPFNSYCGYKYKIRPEVELVVDLEQIVLPDMVNLTAKCPERVTSMIIMGKVSSAILNVLFKTFTNVTRSLTFTDNCDYVDSSDEQWTFEQSILNASNLVFTNLTECVDLYMFVSNNFIFSRNVTINFENSFLSPTNVAEIEKIVCGKGNVVGLTCFGTYCLKSFGKSNIRCHSKLDPYIIRPRM